MKDFIRVFDCRIARNEYEEELEAKVCDRFAMSGVPLVPADLGAFPFSEFDNRLELLLQTGTRALSRTPSRLTPR